MIEVEKKFTVPPSFEDVLARVGAVLVMEKEFLDSYYDFTDFKLSLQDCWLRERNNSWELKHRDKHSKSRSTTTDSYYEVDNEKEILRSVATYVSMDTSVKSVQEFVTGSRLRVFASFKTRRMRYEIDGLFIDLDSASFGYNVGEIEMMVGSKDDIAGAEIKIESLAKRLGINWKTKQHGKLGEYLYLNNPTLFKQLVESKVLRGK
ncbi:thiamine-triphosphatase-like [Actinia tenebrosa]|uniref:Thiamine-triphosphatase-like n=1 Tax=Actinia tenebrosa TaxID=6105 RepID=A0A6P8I9Z9_ACTTE|nr:thiamine-triphosphatase-like [Actinia tenebrosa]